MVNEVRTNSGAKLVMKAVPAFSITASLLPAVISGAEPMASGE